MNATWQKLPAEMVQKVLEMACKSSAATACQVCLVSKWAYGIGSAARYGVVTLTEKELVAITVGSPVEPALKYAKALLLPQAFMWVAGVLVATIERAINLEHLSVDNRTIFEVGALSDSVLRAWSIDIFPHWNYEHHPLGTIHESVSNLFGTIEGAETTSSSFSPARVTHLHVDDGAMFLSADPILPYFPKLTHIAWTFRGK